MRLRFAQGHGYATWVDEGRFGLRNLGVPWSGPLDPLAWRCAQVAVGCGNSEACLELRAIGFDAEVLEPGTLVWLGADSDLYCNGRNFGSQGRASFQSGDSLSLRSYRNGATLYLATPSGWLTPQYAGSVCGPFDGLEIRSTSNYQTQSSSTIAWKPGWLYQNKLELPWVRQANLQEQAMPDIPATLELCVDSKTSRIGLRLIGQVAQHTIELPSAPVASGMIQWTPSGELIVIGPDGPTLGGYPTLGYVPQLALPLVGQLTIGQNLRLIPCGTNEEAQLQKAWHDALRAAELSALLL